MTKTIVNGQERVVIREDDAETTGVGSTPPDVVVEQPAPAETAQPVVKPRTRR